MRVVSRRLNAKTAADMIKNTYLTFPENRKPSLIKRSWEIWLDYLSCIKNPTEEDVVSITGNDDWIRIECDVCGSKVEAAAQFETSDWPICICHDCLISAANEVVMEVTK